MPIGKSSIEKRVAKTEPEKKNQAPELVATTGVAPAKKAPAKKSATATKTTAPKTPAAKKPAAKKPAAPKTTKTEKLTPPTDVSTGVLTNIAPETVEKVIGRKEKEACEIVQVGQKLPSHLL